MENVKEQLTKYYELSQKTRDEVEGGDIASDEALEMIDLERAILKAYGLPCTSPYMDILQFFGFEEQIDDEKIQGVLHELESYAISFLASPAETDEQILHNGKENHKHALDVLRLMGFVEVTQYQMFLYEELWLRKNYAAKDIINELKYAENFDNAVSEIDYQYKRNKNRETYFAKAEKLLNIAGAKYTDEYLAYLKKEQLPEKLIRSIDRKSISWSSNSYNPEILETNKFYMDNVIFYDRTKDDEQIFVGITIFSRYNNRWQRYVIEMPIEQLQQLLLQCTQTSVAETVNGNVDAYEENINDYESGYNYDIRRYAKTYLECNAQIKASWIYSTGCVTHYELLGIGK